MADVASWCEALRGTLEEHRKELQNRHCKNWREKNRDHFNEYHRSYRQKKMQDPEQRAQRNEYQRNYYHERAKDPEYQEKCREASRKSYLKRKQTLQQN